MQDSIQKCFTPDLRFQRRWTLFFTVCKTFRLDVYGIFGRHTWSSANTRCDKNKIYPEIEIHSVTELNRIYDARGEYHGPIKEACKMQNLSIRTGKQKHGETRHSSLFVCHTLQWANLQKIWWNDMDYMMFSIRGLKPPDFEPFLPPAIWRCPTSLWLREKPRGRRRRRTQRCTFSNDPASLRMIGGCKLKSVAPNLYGKSSSVWMFDVLIILRSS